MKRIALFILAALVAIGSAFAYRAYLERAARHAAIEEQHEITVPKATPKQQPKQFSRSSSSVAISDLSPEVNWDVPFTSQAPLLNWDAEHEEACEEASALMVLRYFAGEKFASPEDANNGINELLHLNEQMGYPIDQTAQQVAALLALKNEKLRISVVADPTEASLKRALAGGSLIIVPAAGRLLGNPYFQRPGPVYHMLVLRGYTANGYVITNDPGTKRGKEFVYTWPVLLNAIHDWNGGDDIEKGAKVAIIVGQYVIKREPR